ncbi:MAG: YebC/PmpR family DNA-binding transcriptional regulator [Clostridiales bacterium]|jgi:YebC/PmpR family DNA-binding regulatory protein|nr:YebC/PmpR family DNA-binding transcriptional regulator [Clostridiales bacterium]
MSGHSKFANIKHKKERSDAARGRVFTRLGREISVAVKAGGADPASNSRLRDIVAKAKASNMPNDTIERSIKKAVGETDSVNFESVTYEGYGPSGVAVIIEALTDNKSRTVANVRSAFTKGGCGMGAPGCVARLFDEKGLIMVEKDEFGEDELMLLALDAGASDFSAEEDGYEIYTLPEDFSAVREALEKAGVPMVSAEVGKFARTYTELTNPEDVKKMRRILDLLDEEDDVTNVYHSWENED